MKRVLGLIRGWLNLCFCEDSGLSVVQAVIAVTEFLRSVHLVDLQLEI